MNLITKTRCDHMLKGYWEEKEKIRTKSKIISINNCSTFHHVFRIQCCKIHKKFRFAMWGSFRFVICTWFFINGITQNSAQLHTVYVLIVSSIEFATIFRRQKMCSFVSHVFICCQICIFFVCLISGDWSIHEFRTNLENQQFFLVFGKIVAK